MRKILCLSASLLAIFAAQAHAQCGNEAPRSILDNLLEAKIVAVGRLQNAVRPDNALPAGQVEFTLDEVLVTHAAIKGKTSIVIARYEKPTNGKFLVAMGHVMIRYLPIPRETWPHFQDDPNVSVPSFAKTPNHLYPQLLLHRSEPRPPMHEKSSD